MMSWVMLEPEPPCLGSLSLSLTVLNLMMTAMNWSINPIFDMEWCVDEDRFVGGIYKLVGFVVGSFHHPEDR